MYPYSDLHTDLRDYAVGVALFDSYRLVDTKTNLVHSYSACSESDVPVCSEDLCYRVWGRKRPCENCTSQACLDKQEQVIKMEQLNGRVLLISSLPTVIAGRPYALELVKDVTSSLMVTDEIAHENIEITSMIDRFNTLAVRDAFTMLYNKTFIHSELETLASQAEDQLAEDGRPAALVAIDVDLFREINDNHGHSTGDDVLLHLAQQFKKVARSLEDGWAGRFGGDEFFLCAPHGLDRKDLEFLETTIADAERHRFENGSLPFGITVSYGIAYLQAGDTRRSFMERADEAMYAAKRERHRRQQG
ncbi:GGDEF domain-containing protein [Paraeggerthella hominis]|uniref:GGDEF domain-containing protein n=1 Tax=Paraeggerthella hominis TaxID=2897351 RepID=UPI003D0C8ECC